MTLRITAVLLSLFAALPAQEARTQATITPDQRMQDHIQRVLDAATAEDQEAALDVLSANAGAQHERLVRELFFFSEAADSTREGMLLGVVLDRLRIPPAHVIAALVPLLETDDPARRAEVGGVLAEYEDLSIDRGANFDAYRPLLERELPVGLVRHLYATDADAALLTLMRARMHDRAEVRALLQAQHVIAELRWQLRFGFLARADLPQEASPAVLDALGFLAGHEAWWVRLGAARLAEDQPALAAAAQLERLATDEHRLVREVASRAKVRLR